MEILRTVIIIALIIACIALTIIILLQEGKSQGLGALSGAASPDSYWGKNKGRSMEGNLVKITTVLVVIFMVASCVLNTGFFNK